MNVTRNPAIVVGVSGSRASQAALRWAAAEADRVHGQLRIVMAVERPARAYYARPAPAGEPQFVRDKARRDLAAAVRTALGPGVRPDTTSDLIEGMAERTLVDCSGGADLLVLGCESGLDAGRSIGPVIRSCLSHAHCPVVVISPQNLTLRDEPPADAGLDGGFDSRFLVAAGAVPAPRPGE